MTIKKYEETIDTGKYQRKSSSSSTLQVLGNVPVPTFHSQTDLFPGLSTSLLPEGL